MAKYNFEVESRPTASDVGVLADSVVSKIRERVLCSRVLLALGLIGPGLSAVLEVRQKPAVIPENTDDALLKAGGRLACLFFNCITHTDLNTASRGFNDIVEEYRGIVGDYDKTFDDFKHLFRSPKISKRLKKVYEFLQGEPVEESPTVSKLYYDLCLLMKESYKATIYATNTYEDKLTMSYGDKWKSCQRITPADLPKEHPLFNPEKTEDAGCYASKATSVALDSNIWMLYTSKDGEPYNMSHRALAFDLDCKGFNAIQVERLYPDERDGDSIRGSALHNAFLEAAKSLATKLHPRITEWVVARSVPMATTEWFYLDSENGSEGKTTVLLPASVVDGKNPEDFVQDYLYSNYRIEVGEEPQCTHCGASIDKENSRATCSACGGYDGFFSSCDYCGTPIEAEGDAWVGVREERTTTTHFYFCCEDCAEREHFVPVGDDDLLHHIDDVTYDKDGTAWANLDNVEWSEYCEDYLPKNRAVYSDYHGSFIDEQNSVRGYYGEDPDEEIDDWIDVDIVRYCKTHDTHIQEDFAVWDSVCHDWVHEDWGEDKKKLVVVERPFNRQGEVELAKFGQHRGVMLNRHQGYKDVVLPIEETVYSKTLGRRIAKADAWYHEGEDYNPESVVRATFRDFFSLFKNRLCNEYAGFEGCTYKPTTPNEIEHIVQSNWKLVRSFCERVGASWVITPDPARTTRCAVIDQFRYNTEKQVGRKLTSILLTDDGNLKSYEFGLAA